MSLFFAAAQMKERGVEASQELPLRLIRHGSANRWALRRCTDLTEFRNLKSLSLVSIPSMHIHAAVDDDGLAGHEVAVVGGEEDDRAD